MLPEDERLRVHAYLLRCMDVLDLRQWRWIVSANPADDNANAMVDVTQRRYVVTVRLSPHWMDYNQLLKRRTLFHESLHLIHVRQERGLIDHLEDKTNITADLWDTVHSTYLTDSEYMVDHLTTVFERARIFPAWPTLDQARKTGVVPHLEL